MQVLFDKCVFVMIVESFEVLLVFRFYLEKKAMFFESTTINSDGEQSFTYLWNVRMRHIRVRLKRRIKDMTPFIL